MQKKSFTMFNIEQFLNLREQDNIWLVKNFIPRIGKSIAYGDGGSFKTTVMFDLAVAIASKGALLRHFKLECTGPVLVVSTESSIYTNRSRVLSHIRGREGVSPESLMRVSPMGLPTKHEMPFYYSHKRLSFEDDADKVTFMDALNRINDETGSYPVFILLDPLDSFIRGNENSASETKQFRSFMDYVVDQYETSVCVIHHSTKDKETPSIRGSSAWRGWTDAALHFKKHSLSVGKEIINYVQVSSDKQRDGEEGILFTAVPQINTSLGITTFKLLEDNINPDTIVQTVDQNKIVDFLRSYGPATQTDISKYTGIYYQKVRTTIGHLAAAGYLAKTSVTRPTSADGTRNRSVEAWYLTNKVSNVDQVAAILKASTVTDEVEEHGYEIHVIGPPTDDNLESFKDNGNR